MDPDGVRKDEQEKNMPDEGKEWRDLGDDRSDFLVGRSDKIGWLRRILVQARQAWDGPQRRGFWLHHHQRHCKGRPAPN
jgi:hypothetical protein